MSKRIAVCVAFFAAFILLLPAAAQENGNQRQSLSICTFEDGNEISVRYVAAEYSRKNEAPAGKPWTPSGSPIFLFTPTNLTIGNATVPTGAYSVYTIRNKNEWTLIVNKNVTQDSAYDPTQDIVRVKMETGGLTSNKPFNVSLGHIQPKVCSIQIVYGDSASWTDLKQQ